MSGSDSFEFHVISQTHWDREWRMPFQQTRVMLVDMMDHLIELLESDPEYRHYHLDGQTILLEDYLEVRPENRERLTSLIVEGRILVGPWYTLPEENLVDGECLIRNLRMGHAVARELGGAMKVGFTPSSYGQVSQLPQILAGFGIDSAIFHRGVPAHDVDLEYTWEGSDGTQMLAVRPSSGGRFNFSTLVMNRLLCSGNGEAFPYTPASARDLYRSSNLKSQCDETYYSSAVPSSWEEGKLAGVLKNLRELVSRGALTRYLVCGEGHDSMEPNPELTRVVAAANRLGGPDRYIISSLPAYIDRLRKAVRSSRVLKGEIRSTQKTAAGARLYAGTLSSRMYLKQMNRRAEGLLLKWAEPFSALAWTLGESYPRLLLKRAWQYLLANHAHDSISGTGIDQVHDDMVYRFDQCRLLAGELKRKALAGIVDRIDTGPAREGEVLITIFNPLAFDRDEVVELDIDLPDSSEQAFRILDSDGCEIEYAELGTAETVCTVQQTHGFPYRFHVLRHRVCMMARALPGVGYRTYRVQPLSAGAGAVEAAESPDCVKVTGDRQMENQFIRVRIHENGTLQILDKVTGRSYDHLNAFEDGGEIGDSYEHVAPRDDLVVDSSACAADVEIITSTPLVSTFRVTLAMRLPESIAPGRQKRSGHCQECIISSTITLKKGARRVDVSTRLNNNVRDHRLRVIFPLNIPASHVWAETQCDVVKRPVARPDCEGWLEPYCPTQPQLHFVDVHENGLGCAVLNRGLPEYEVSDDGRGSIAVTLLRCFTHKVRATQQEDFTQTGMQCPGEHEFQYSIYPHSGDTFAGGVVPQAYRHGYLVKVVQSWVHDSDRPAGRRLPMAMGALRIMPADLVLSSVTQAENGRDLVVRLFNPTWAPIDGHIQAHRPIRRASILDLEENVVGACPMVGDHELALKVAPKKIITLALTLVP